MIKIGNPEITLSCGLAKLSAKIYADGDEHELWLSVDSRYARFLCAERSDAFLLALLPYAFISGHDIECVAPVTERLYRQLMEQFLPAFYKINGYSRDERHAAGFAVNVIAELADEVEHPTNGNQVGTGCSCGVDSMHVYAVNTDLTLACLWNVHGVTADETQGKREVGWRNLVRQAKAFTNSIGKELLIADTNFDRGCFPELRWDGMTPYGNMFCVFALQKLWSKFYVASGCDAAAIRLCQPMSADPAHYEFVLYPYLCLRNIVVRIDGVAASRVDKVRDLGEYKPSFGFLNVCHDIREDGRNCTFGCAKCMRTVMDLDAAGVLSKYERLFDLGYYRDHQDEFLAEYWRGILQGNNYIIELKPYFQKKHFGFYVKIKAFLILAKKITKKICRRGKTNCGRFNSRG